MENKHSRFGIASFVLSLVVGFSLIVLVLATAIHRHRNPEVSRVFNMVLGTAMFGLFLGDLLAAALGIAAVCQKERQKVFGVLGLSFSLLIIMGTTILMIVGFIASRTR